MIAACAPGTHHWLYTRRREEHVSFPTPTRGRRVLNAIFVRCCICQQDGFSRPGSSVVYTWSKADAE